MNDEILNPYITIKDELINAYIDLGVSREDIDEDLQNRRETDFSEITLFQLQDAIEATKELLEEKEEQCAMSDALKRLDDNSDFNKIIVDGYYNEEKDRLAGAITSNMPLSGEERGSMISQLEAIGRFKRYLSGLVVGDDSLIELVRLKVDLDMYAQIIENRGK